MPTRLGALALLFAAPASADVPHNLSATFRSGQVFLTWDEDPAASDYKVYKIAGAPSEADLKAGNLRVLVPKGFADNPILDGLSQGESVYGNSGWTSVNPPCVIRRNVAVGLDPSATGVALPLAAGKNLAVLTSASPGTFWYAVTSVMAGTETKKVHSGSDGNVTGPVVESVEEPEPVLIWQSRSKAARMYLQYVDMEKFNTSQYAWPYWVGVKPGAKTGVTELLLQGGDQHMREAADSVTGFEYADRGISVKVMPTEEWELWYGHSATFNYRTAPDGAAADTGPIVNFTQARTLDFLRWLIRKGPFADRIDSNRIEVSGGSNGGFGCLQFAMNYPDLFAFGRCDVPPTNIQDKRYGSGRYDIFFGKPGQKLAAAFTGWKSERLTALFGGTPIDKWLNLEKMALEKTGADYPWIQMGHGGKDQVVAWPEQGRDLYTSLNAARRGFSGGVDGSAGHDMTGVPEIAQLAALRKNDSYPAVSNSKQSAALPLPDRTDAKVYTINTHLLWSTPYFKVGGYQGIVDEPNRYEIVVASSKGDDVADITPRRFQRFNVTPGAVYCLSNQAVNDPATIYQADTVQADSQGLITFKRFLIKGGTASAGGSRLAISPKQPVSALPSRFLGARSRPGSGMLASAQAAERFLHAHPRARIFDIHGSMVWEPGLSASREGRIRSLLRKGSGPYWYRLDP